MKSRLSIFRSAATKLSPPRKHLFRKLHSARGSLLASNSSRSITAPNPRSIARQKTHATVATNGNSDTTNPDWKAPMATPWIVRFYGEEADPDLEGRTLDDILHFSDRELEYNHDYIQVLFPLPERSPFNPEAPVLSKVTRDAFAENESLRNNLFMAFKRMAHFYAFDLSGDEAHLVLTPKNKFRKLAGQTWLTRMDHNHLRITRIIRCLRILGLEPVAHAFLEALKSNEGGAVGPRSIMYWERAAYRPLHLPPDESNENAQGIKWLRPEAEEAGDKVKTDEAPEKDENANKAEVDENSKIVEDPKNDETAESDEVAEKDGSMEKNEGAKDQ